MKRDHYLVYPSQKELLWIVNPKELIITPKLPAPPDIHRRGFLFPVVFSFHKKEPIIPQRQVTIFIAEIVHHSFFISVGTGEVLKIESFFDQAVSRNLCGFIGNQFFQDPAVLAQNIIDASNTGVGIIIQSVVVGASAIIVTEFFVGPSFDGAAARHAGLVGGEGLHLIRLDLKINEDANRREVFFPFISVIFSIEEC